MDTTIILSQILGIIFTTFGISVLVNKKSIIAILDSTTQSQGILWILGFITLISGTLLVAFHNTWSFGLPLFITIVGWLTLLKGVVTLVFPDFTVSFYKKWFGRNTILLSGFIAFTIGVVLLYLGFF